MGELFWERKLDVGRLGHSLATKNELSKKTEISTSQSREPAITDLHEGAHSSCYKVVFGLPSGNSVFLSTVIMLIRCRIKNYIDTGLKSTL